MILQHYLQLLAYYRRWVISTIVVTAVATAVWSTNRLANSPVFTAAAVVAMLPTESQLTAGRDAGPGARATVRGLTETHMEYLKSRPVVESAYEQIEGTGLLKKSVDSDNDSVLAGLVRRAREIARRSYRIVDSGRYAPRSPREKALQNLTDAISLHKVTDSYVLRIEVNLPDPEAAAIVANSLAEAYVEQTSERLKFSADQMEQFLQDRIVPREDAMKQLLDREEALEKKFGIMSLEDERQFLMNAREVERQKLVDAQVEHEAARSKVSMLNREDLAHSGRSIAEVNEARSLAVARRDAAKLSVDLRKQTVNELSTALDDLNEKEESFVALQRQRLMMEAELAELNTLLLSTNLARSEAISQVSVIDPARPSRYPSSPRVVVNTVTAVVASVLMALFALIVIDTLSGTVKTVPDLARLVGPRSLGRLDRGSVAAAATAPARERAAGMQRRLTRLGAVLEQRLVLLGAFEASAIQVTGFVEPRRLREAAITLGTALASLGRTVVCRIPPDNSIPMPKEPTMDGRLHFVDEGWGSPNASAIRINCFGPVNSEFRLTEAAIGSAALLCVLPVGRVSESVVNDFLEKSLAERLSVVSFVLMER